MEHNRNKALGETFDVLFYGDTEIQFSMYKLSGTDDAIDITPNSDLITIGDHIKKQEVTMPNEDCIVVFKNGIHSTIVRVGDPAVEIIYVDRTNKTSVNLVRNTIDGNEIESGNMINRGHNMFTYVPSDSQYSTIEIDGVLGILDVPYTVECKGNSGTIRLQRGVWQLIAINREDAKVAEYLCDRLAEQENVDASDLIEVVNTYRGSDNKFLSYVPGVTSKASINNFTLVYNDDGNKEIAGVWVKAKAWTHTSDDLVISWDNN